MADTTPKKVYLYSATTGEQYKESFLSASLCAKKLGVSPTLIARSLKKKHKVKGYYVSSQKFKNWYDKNNKDAKVIAPAKKGVVVEKLPADKNYKKALDENKKILEEIKEIEKSDIYVAKTKLLQIQREKDSLVVENKRHMTELTNLEKKIDFLEGVNVDIKQKKWTIGKSAKIQREASVISLLSDLHAEERVTREVTNGLNEYNLEICQQRVKNYFIKLLKLTNRERRDIKITKVYIGFLGDMISGYLHEELKQNNLLSPTEAVVFCMELLFNGLKFLSDNGDFKQIDVICKQGNHGRNFAKKTFATGYKNSYEYMMYQILAKNMKVAGYNNINFNIEQGEFTYVDIYDKKIRFCHGDHFNYRGGVGGIEIPMKTWLYKINTQIKADMTYLAHWHDYIRTSNAVINPSVMGLNAYGLGFGFPSAPLRQHFELLDSERGFTINAPIWLD